MSRLRTLLPYVLPLACNGGGASKEPETIPADCLEAEQHSDLMWIQANVFAKSCVFRSCHGRAAPQAKLDLSTVELSAATTVMVASSMCPTDPGGGSQFRVVPGNPNASWLMKMIGQIPDTTPPSCSINPTVGLMPKGNHLLCSQKRHAIERWIASGAPVR